MIAHRFENLIVWQLAKQLQDEVFAFTSHPNVARDFKFCAQIRESTRSATRNTAEGFGRFDPTEFRRFLKIAALPTEHERLMRLALRAIKANNRLKAYLLRCGNRKPRPAPVSLGE